MVTVITAYSREVDDHAKAIEEIQEQLRLEGKQRAHTAALIFCHSAFIESGAAAAVCGSLPFMVLGCSSQFFALPGAADEILLSVMILSSNDVEFAAGVSGPLSAENLDDQMRTLYRETAASIGAEPVFIFAFQPTMYNLSGDIITAAVDRACGGIPVFGSSALDVGVGIRNPKIIFQGDAYSDRAALLLCSSPFKPRFFSVPFAGKSVFAQDTVITSAAGNLITGINNRPAVTFMEELGLMQPLGEIGTLALPLMVDYHDGTDLCAVIIDGATPEGALITSRYLRDGGILNIGSISADNVLESAKTLARDIKKSGDSAGIIIFSCFLRNVALGGKSMAEIELMQKELAASSVPYLFLYSGGELCPRYTEAGGTVNRFYQYALIACQF